MESRRNGPQLSPRHDDDDDDYAQVKNCFDLRLHKTDIPYQHRDTLAY